MIAAPSQGVPDRSALLWSCEAACTELPNPAIADKDVFAASTF